MEQEGGVWGLSGAGGSWYWGTWAVSRGGRGRRVRCRARTAGGVLPAGPGRSGLRSHWLKRVSSHGPVFTDGRYGLIRKQLEGGQGCRQCLAGVAGQPDNLGPK